MYRHLHDLYLVTRGDGMVVVRGHFIDEPRYDKHGVYLEGFQEDGDVGVEFLLDEGGVSLGCLFDDVHAALAHELADTLRREGWCVR